MDVEEADRTRYATLFNYQKDIIKELQMGVNYTQRCILGFLIEADDIEETLEPAIYDEQPRYDTKTGKQTHTERVLVKERVKIFKWADLENEYLYDLGENIADKYDISFVVDQHCEFLYIGLDVADSYEYGRVDLLEDTVSLESLQGGVEELQEKFPNCKDEISLHFVSNVG